MALCSIGKTLMLSWALLDNVLTLLKYWFCMALSVETVNLDKLDSMLFTLSTSS